MADPELPPSVDASWVTAFTRFAKLRMFARFRSTPGLQTLDVVLTAEDTILQSKVAAPVLGRIADCNDIPPFQVFRLPGRQRKNPIVWQVRYLEERHVPIRVDHFHTKNLYGGVPVQSRRSRSDVES